MIISASYKTDIPAFYGKWFINRLDAGFCYVRNPYGNQAVKISLKPEDVDGIVFWTKNIGPFTNHLEVVKQRGFPFVIQYTINDYPRILETSVVDAKRSIDHMKLICDLYGPRVGVWRYDTIIITSLTPVDFHLRNFEHLAKLLEGFTDEVIISFAQLYKKAIRNINKAAKGNNFSWQDPEEKEKIQLLSTLDLIAKSHGIQMSICSQPQFLVDGLKEARCVDIKRLSDVAGRPIYSKLHGMRAGCGCFASRDIGEYDTCPHGCVYCYAVSNRDLALRHYKQHNDQSEFLYKSPAIKNIENTESSDNESNQLKLF